MNADDYLDDDDDDRFIRLDIFNRRLDNVGGRCRICRRAIHILIEVEEWNEDTGEFRTGVMAIPFTSYLAWLNVSSDTVNPVGVWCSSCDETADVKGHMRYFTDHEELLDILMGVRLTLDEETQLLRMEDTDEKEN